MNLRVTLIILCAIKEWEYTKGLRNKITHTHTHVHACTYISIFLIHRCLGTYVFVITSNKKNTALNHNWSLNWIILTKEVVIYCRWLSRFVQWGWKKSKTEIDMLVYVSMLQAMQKTFTMCNVHAKQASSSNTSLCKISNIYFNI